MQRFVVLFGLLGFLFGDLFAQPPLICHVNTAGTPLLRAESRTELTGDIVIACQGGDPNSTFFFNLDLFLNAKVTSRVLDATSQETEALLLIDEPQPGVVNQANRVFYHGQVKSMPGIAPGPAGSPGAPGSGNVYHARWFPGQPNRLSWNGVPFVPAPYPQMRVLRVTNIRIDAAEFASAGSSVVTAFLNVSPAGSLPLANPQIVVGTVTESVAVTVESGTRVEVQFREKFATAFRKRIRNSATNAPLAQDVPGKPHGTESGFTPEYTGLAEGSAGFADSGSRLVIIFENLPVGVVLIVPSFVDSELVSGGDGHLRAVRVSGFDQYYARGLLMPETAPESHIVPVDGVAVLVFEVVEKPPHADKTGADRLEQFVIPIELAYIQPLRELLKQARLVAGFGPILPQAAGNAIPDFIPQFIDFRATSSRMSLMAPPSPIAASFEYVVGDPSPVERAITVDPTFEAQADSLAWFHITGGNWLIAEPVTMPTTRSIRLRVNPEGLPPGTYYGFVTLRLLDPDESLRIVPIELRVLDAPRLVLDTTPISVVVFASEQATRQLVRYLTAQNKAVEFRVETEIEGGTDWLTVTPLAGGTPKNLNISIDASGLRPGLYQAIVRVVSERAVNSPLEIPVSLAVVGEGPLVLPSGVVSAASYTNGRLAPGEIVSIFGFNLGPASPAVALLGSDGRFPTQLAGVRVLIDGQPVPLLFVGGSQINAMIPFEVSGQDSVTLLVEKEGVASPAITLPVVASKPGLLTRGGLGRGQAAAVNEDGSLNSPDRPAQRGSVVSLFGTGAGLLSPLPDIMRPVDPRGQLPVIRGQVRVFIGGVPAQVLYAGTGPGQVPGLFQLNVRVPEEVTPGTAVEVRVEIDGSRSQPGVSLAIQ